jgi:hypothetical protein
MAADPETTKSLFSKAFPDPVKHPSIETILPSTIEDSTETPPKISSEEVTV